MSLADVGQFIISGLTTGSVYALIALGFTLIYNTCDIINFAQGEFAMLGGMLAAVLNGAGLPLFPAVLLAIIIATLIGGLAALTTIYPLRRTSPLNLIILTIGLSIVLQGLAGLIWGKGELTLPAFSGDGVWHPLGITIRYQFAWILGAACLIAVGLFLFFKLTNAGRAMRACAANHRGARICGIEPRRVMVMAFALSAAIGAVGGAVIAPLALAQYNSGTMLGLKGFCAAIIGGLSSLPGAVVGGLTLGVAEALGGGLVATQLKEVLAFLALIVILYLRPQGLFGRRGG